LGSQAALKIEKSVWQFSRKLWNEQQVAWLPIVCPYCSSVVSQKTASQRLTCLGCGREFVLTEVDQEWMENHKAVNLRASNAPHVWP